MTSLFNPISYTTDTDIEYINKVKKCFWIRNPYDLPKNDHPIEKISHHFWLKTHKNTQSTKEVAKKDFENVLDHISVLNSNDKTCFNVDYYLKTPIALVCNGLSHYALANDYKKDEFQHFFWVNDENLYPNSITKLKAVGVEIKNIDTLKPAVKYTDKINEFIDKAFYGSMVDSLKYMALKSYGGLVIDLNFMLENHNLSNFFDLYSGIFLTSDDSIENFFIAANKGNSVINHMSNIIDKMFDNIENNNRIGITFTYYKEASLCTDDNLTRITLGHFPESVNVNINNANELNEIMSYKCINPSVYIGGDNGYSRDTWQNEVIVE